jgi:hypothetical protein
MDWMSPLDFSDRNIDGMHSREYSPYKDESKSDAPKDDDKPDPKEEEKEESYQNHHRFED